MNKKSNKMSILCLSMSVLFSSIGIGLNSNYSMAKYIPSESIKDKANIEYLDNGNSIFWAQGIQHPDYKKDFILDQPKGDDPSYSQLVTSYTPNKGWYDTDKRKDGMDNSLCFAFVAGNMLNWWFDQNREYIEKFLATETDNPGHAPLSDLNELLKQPTTQDREDSPMHLKIMQKFPMQASIQDNKNHIYAHYKSGGWADYVIDFMINGYAPIDPNLTHIEHNSSNYISDPQGGYFYKVFGKNRINKTHVVAQNYKKFSNDLIDVFSNGGMIGLPYEGGANHIITGWGIETDKDNNVVAIYISDSDDYLYNLDDGKKVAIKRYHVFVDDYGNISVGTKYKNGKPAQGVPVSYFNSISLGKDYWEKYFNKGINNKGFNLFSKNVDNGSITFSKSNALEKEEIEIINTPKNGYVSDGYNVYPNSVKVINNKFIMPNSNVTIIPKYKLASSNRVDYIDKIEIISAPKKYNIGDKINYSDIKVRIFDTKKGLQEEVDLSDDRLNLVEFEDLHTIDNTDLNTEKLTIRSDSSTYEFSYNISITDQGVYFSLLEDSANLYDGKFLMVLNGYLIDGKKSIFSKIDDKDIILDQQVYDSILTITNNGLYNSIKTRYGYLDLTNGTIKYTSEPNYIFSLRYDRGAYILKSSKGSINISSNGGNLFFSNGNSYPSLYKINDKEDVVNLIDQVNALVEDSNFEDLKLLKSKYDSLGNLSKSYLDTFTSDQGEILSSKLIRLYDSKKPIIPDPEPETPDITDPEVDPNPEKPGPTDPETNPDIGGGDNPNKPEIDNPDIVDPDSPGPEEKPGPTDPNPDITDPEVEPNPDKPGPTDPETNPDIGEGEKPDITDPETNPNPGEGENPDIIDPKPETPELKPDINGNVDKLENNTLPKYVIALSIIMPIIGIGCIIFSIVRYIKNKKNR